MIKGGLFAPSGRVCLAFFLTSSLLQAAPVNFVSGSASVQCVADTVVLPCVGGRLSTAVDRQGLPQQSVFDSIDNTYQIGFTGFPLETRSTRAIFSASAGAGQLKAGATTSFIARAGAPFAPFERPTAGAEAFFRDEFTVAGPASAVQRLNFSFSLSGDVFDEAGVLLPFGKTYFGPSTATAFFSASINGLNRPIFAGNSAGRSVNDGLPSTAQTIRFSVDVVGGDRLALELALRVQTDMSGTADFLSTGKLDYIEAPAGVSLLSASSENVFIRSGDRLVYDTSALLLPVPIPEPSTAHLCAVGVVVVAFGIRRRSERKRY